MGTAPPEMAAMECRALCPQKGRNLGHDRIQSASATRTVLPEAPALAGANTRACVVPADCACFQR